MPTSLRVGKCASQQTRPGRSSGVVLLWTYVRMGGTDRPAILLLDWRTRHGGAHPEPVPAGSPARRRHGAGSRSPLSVRRTGTPHLAVLGMRCRVGAAPVPAQSELGRLGGEGTRVRGRVGL